MRQLLLFLSSREFMNYVRWRWSRSRGRSFRLPFEWMRAAILIWSVRRRSPGASRDPEAAASREMPRWAGLGLPSEPGSCHVDFVKRYFPRDVEAVVTEANRIRSGSLPLVTGVELDFRAPNWRPNVEDQEHLFALNRWRYGLVLLKAWKCTGDLGYVEHFERLLAGWIAANPPDEENPAWESYSVAERIVNWCACRSFLGELAASDANFFVLLDEQIAQHARWLAGHLETDTAHNHLINNGRALYVYGACFGVRAYRVLGFRILEEQLFRQTRDDGMLGEQSSPYHLLLTRTYIEVGLLEKELPPRMVDRVRQMVAVAAALVREDGTIPVIGDFSPDSDLKSLVGMLAVGQAVLGSDNAVNVPLSEHAAWYLSAEALRRWSCESPSRGTESVYLDSSGYWIARGPGRHVVLHADPRGGVIRHGHADVPGLVVWWRGHDILGDSGNATFTPGVWSEYFRGPAAHNTLTIDELPQYVRPGRLSALFCDSYKQASAGLAPPQRHAHWMWSEAWHDGYARLVEGVRVQRRVVMSDEYVWITDRLEGRGTHQIEACWQWAGNTTRPVTTGEWDIVTPTHWLARGICRCNGSPISPEWSRGGVSPTPLGWFSTSYGSKVPSTMSRFRSEFTSTLRLDTLLWFAGEDGLRSFEVESDGRARIQAAHWADHFERAVDGGLGAARRAVS